MENQNSNNWIKIIGVLLVLGAIAYGVFYFKKNDENVALTPLPAPPASPPTAIIRKYKNGMYSATGNYTSPAQKEEVGVELVIKDDVITSAKFTEHPSNPTTATMQKKFKDGFETFVVGKNVDEINLTVVNGSSLTPKGFMDALNKIKTEAKA